MGFARQPVLGRLGRRRGAPTRGDGAAPRILALSIDCGSGILGFRRRAVQSPGSEAGIARRKKEGSMSSLQSLLQRVRQVRRKWQTERLVKGVSLFLAAAIAALVFGVWGADLFGFTPPA